jgi:hypothetical protein
MLEPALPTESLVVTFFEHPVLAARVRDGTILLSVRDLCDAVGLRRYSQIRRIRADAELRDGLQTLRVPTAGGPQEVEFLILEFVPAWISTVDRSRASTVVQERLRFLRLFSIRHVYDAITQAAGLPSGTSRNIEDLRDLQQFDEAIHGIAERQRALEESQQALESSQEKARQAWRDHEHRIRALEEQRAQNLTLSPIQRGHMYQLVHIWAQARVAREGIAFSAAIKGCWGVLKGRYQVAKYEDIKASEYDDCIGFVRRSYEKLTGESLAGEQLGLFDSDG